MRYSLRLHPKEDVLRYFDRMQPLATLALRLTLGTILIAHSSHKVWGHMHEYAGFIASLGMPHWLGYVSALTEFVGGILVIMGLFTRCAAFAILIDMCVAIARVHWKHGLLGPGGYEFPLSLATIAFALIFFGGGAISLDAIRGGVFRGRSKIK
jgi:putative oxidoreductase